MTGQLARLDHALHSGIPVCSIVGEIDLSNADALAGQLLATVRDDASGLIVDLSATSYVDSAGLRVLADLAELLTGTRRRLLLVVPPATPIAKLITISGITSQAPMLDKLGDALAELS